MAATQAQHTTPPQHTTQLVGDFILDRPQAWGVHRIYGYPGDSINGVVGALRRAGDRFDFIQVAHEQLAGFMATAHAKFSGEVGACLATSGLSAINMLTGLYDAKMDHHPVVAILGQQSLHSLGASAQQETHLVDLPFVTGSAGWLARFIRLRQGMKFALSGNLSTMGSAVPYATAA